MPYYNEYPHDHAHRRSIPTIHIGQYQTGACPVCGEDTDDSRDTCTHCDEEIDRLIDPVTVWGARCMIPGCLPESDTVFFGDSGSPLSAMLEYLQLFDLPGDPVCIESLAALTEARYDSDHKALTEWIKG
jgi:predicted amidophosphoribosyltransferase